MASTADISRLREQVGDLVARHSDVRSAKDFARYKDDPVGFMREELSFDPYPKQVEIIESYIHNRRTAVHGFHGAGKDAVLAAIALHAAYCRGMLVLAISATERQLLGQLWREIGSRFAQRLPGELYTSDLRIGGKKRIIAMTSGSTSQLTGWHDPQGVCILISESQSEPVEDHAFDAAIANAIDEASRIVVAGNPIGAGRFYEVCHKPTWNAIGVSCFDHPNLKEGREVIPGGPSPNWPAEMEAEFGVESPWFIARVLGQFPPDGSLDSLIKPRWLEPAYERWDEQGGMLPGSRKLGGRAPVIGLDVARSLERDESVAAVVQQTRVHRLVAWRSRDLVDTADRAIKVAAEAYREWWSLSNSIPAPDTQAAHIVIDAPGIGSGAHDECKRRGQSVEEYWGWTPSREPKRFLNKRADVFWNLRTLLENGTVSLPRDPMLREEMLAIEWSEDTKGRIVIGSKDLIRASLKRSPDRCDSVTMGLARTTGALRGQSGFIGTFTF